MDSDRDYMWVYDQADAYRATGAAEYQQLMDMTNYYYELDISKDPAAEKEKKGLYKRIYGQASVIRMDWEKKDEAGKTVLDYWYDQQMAAEESKK